MLLSLNVAIVAAPFLFAWLFYLKARKGQRSIVAWPIFGFAVFVMAATAAALVTNQLYHEYGFLQDVGRGGDYRLRQALEISISIGFGVLCTGIALVRSAEARDDPFISADAKLAVQELTRLGALDAETLVGSPLSAVAEVSGLFEHLEMMGLLPHGSDSDVAKEVEVSFEVNATDSHAVVQALKILGKDMPDWYAVSEPAKRWSRGAG